MIDKLQRIQNAAARIVAQVKMCDHITPLLIDLHWLPISKRIVYKILLITFKALHGKAPQYIRDLLEPLNHSRSLRSNNQLLLKCPKTNMVKYGDRCYCKAAPTLWNSLPLNVRSCVTVDTFKSKLKTVLFNEAYGQLS